MRTIFIIISWIAVAVFAAYIAGVRIVVIQPLGVLPDGVTAIVMGVKNVNFIDSPDAICIRNEGGVSILCRAREGAAIAEHGTILLRLPYSEMLFKLTGG